MHTQTYKVKGMHCASCSSVIEKTFKKVEGVMSVEVNYGTEKVKISFDPSKTKPHDLSKHIEPLGYSLEVPSTAKEMERMPARVRRRRIQFGVWLAGSKPCGYASPQGFGWQHAGPTLSLGAGVDFCGVMPFAIAVIMPPRTQRFARPGSPSIATSRRSAP